MKICLNGYITDYEPTPEEISEHEEIERQIEALPEEDPTPEELLSIITEGAI